MLYCVHRFEETAVKRSFLILLAVLACATGTVQAQAPVAAPAAPLVILVGGPPGTPGDIVARAISGPLAIELGQPVVVENRPGAAGTVAMAALARGRGDGQTLGVLGLQSAVAPSLLKTMPYDTARELVPVRQRSSVSNVLVVRPDGPFGSLADVLVAGRGDSLTYASGGNGTPAHLAAELFRQETGLKLQHVPFNGAVAGVTALLGGHVQLMFATTPSVLPLIRSGKLRALATSAAQRLPGLPELPTLAESGLPAVTVRDWHGLVAPAGTAPQRIEQLSSAVAKALATEAVQQRLAAAGLEPAMASGPAEFRTLVASEMARWAVIVGRASISMQ
jgi:tripartite-type tricarboxylate transporter receptor subunit TctC